MKRQLLLLFLSALLSCTAWAQADTPGRPSADSTKAKAKHAAKAPDTTAAKAAAVRMIADTTHTAKDCGCDATAVYHPEWKGRGGWLLVFTPALIFLLIGIIALICMRGFNLKQALTESNGAKITERNELYKKENFEDLIKSLNSTAGTNTPAMTVLTNISNLIPATIEKTPLDKTGQPIFRPSISRFIALVSTLIIVVIAVAMSCLFMYRYMAYGCPPNFGGLTTILLALGIGIVPYAVNKASGAMSSGSGNS